jgi:hypothetical protein
MTTTMRPPVVPPTDGAPEPSQIRWDRAVVGLLIIALGAGWLLDAIGVSVPWRLFPAAGLVAVGGALLLARRYRGGLIGLGVVLVLAALLSAVTAARFVGPVGQRTITPVVAEWPVDSSLSVGNLTVDLTGRVLPLDEEMRVGVGVGEIQLIVPAGAQVRVDASVGLGDIRVDGVSVDNGFSTQWTEAATTAGAVLVDAQVGLGSIEVRHE